MAARAACALLVGLVIAEVLVGCGGGAGNSGTSTTPAKIASTPSGGGGAAGGQGAPGTAAKSGSSAGAGGAKGANEGGQAGGNAHAAKPDGGSATPPAGGGSGQAGAKPPGKSGGDQPSGGDQTNNQVEFGLAFQCQTGPDATPEQRADGCLPKEQFGAVTLGQSRTMATTLTSFDASVDVKIANVTIDGENPEDFSLDRGTCTDGAEVVGRAPDSDPNPAPAQSCPLRVTFNPTVADGRRATLSIATDPSTAGMTVVLRGTGSTP